MRRGTAFETVLRKSGKLADLEGVAQSWFEDGPDIAQATAGARTRNRAKVATYLLQSVFARHRDKWADLLLRTALWMREAPLELDLCWRELAIVAKALADGRDMGEIGLMRDIAQRTLAILVTTGACDRDDVLHSSLLSACLANSTIRIAFFAANPIRTTSLISTRIFRSRPRIVRVN
jgi:hypothetical protein